MAFIDKDALLGYIKDDNIEAITKGDDTILNDPIADAESLIRDYLDHRYNVDTIFADPTNSNYRTLRKCGIDMALYNLYSGKVNPRHIPDLRVINNELALKTLDKFAKGMIGNNLPYLADEETKPLGRTTTTYEDKIDTIW